VGMAVVPSAARPRNASVILGMLWENDNE